MTAVEEFNKRIRRMIKEEGLVDMKLSRPSNSFVTTEEMARGILNMMDAPTVKDPNFF